MQIRYHLSDPIMKIFLFWGLILVGFVALWVNFRYPIKRIWLHKRIIRWILLLKKNNSDVRLLKIKNNLKRLILLYENHYGFKFANLDTQLTGKKYKKHEINEFLFWDNLKYSVLAFFDNQVELDLDAFFMDLYTLSFIYPYEKKNRIMNHLNKGLK